MPRIAFTSVGCKLNRYEIQLMSETLGHSGFVTVPFPREADCYVINTCTVTGDADLSSRQLIRRAKRKNPAARVVVTGCYSQLRPEEMRELEVDLIISNREKDSLPERILQLFGMAEDAIEHDSEFISGMNGLTRAFVKIEDGCDEECTFCTIWMARGPVISRPVDQIMREINSLASNGYKEVALTGVHIGKYNYEGIAFAGLLRELLAGTSIPRIRLSSLNPIEISDELIELMESDKRICPHVHLSIQSGDDDILQAMGRKYNSFKTREVIGKLVDRIPNITIGADLIVGFPGETDQQFQNTFNLVKTSEIHHLHVFPYSDRPGTRASNLPKKIPSDLKDSRTEKLRILGRERKQKHLGDFIGKKLAVLFENRNRRNDGKMTGLSENYLRVEAPEMADLKGSVSDVYPIAAQGDILIANTINNSEK